MTEKKNGRRTTRQTRGWRLEDPAQVGIAHMQTLLATERHTQDLKTDKTMSETAYHLSTEPAAKRSERRWAAVIRDHWGIESRNHGRRDNYLLEDKTRSKNAAVVGNFCVARAVVLYFNAQTETGNINEFVEECQESKRKTLNMIMRQSRAK